MHLKSVALAVVLRTNPGTPSGSLTEEEKAEMGPASVWALAGVTAGRVRDTGNS